MTRKEKILSKIRLNKGIGLELGPLSTPVVTKDEANIYYVDHISTAQLKKKYANEPVNLDDIVAVDFVLGNASLKDVVKTKKFDYVVASHVIEHVPDVIGWFTEINSVLNKGGILSLVIPDKRYTFDITRDNSRPADIIGALIDKLNRTSSARMYDFASEYRKEVLATEVLLAPFADYTKKPKRYNLTESLSMTKKNAIGKEYVDSHSFVFTPYTFIEIIKQLIEHNMFNYTVVDFHDTAKDELEFYVSLRKNDKASKAIRLKSLPVLPKPLTNAQLHQKILNIEQQLHEILTSTSWRVTKPIRSASVTKIRHLLK